MLILEVIRLKVRKKGIIIIPKRIREKYKIKENSYVLAELKDEGILLKPISIDEISEFLEKHEEKIRSLGIKGPKLGDLRGISLEQEFEE